MADLAFLITVAHGREIKIYTNGKVEGLIGPHAIVNHIPKLLIEANQAGWREGMANAARLTSPTDTDERD